jgi:hypothetical protein
VNVSISFNCFSSVKLVQGVHTERKECVDEICFDSEA